LTETNVALCTRVQELERKYGIARVKMFTQEPQEKRTCCSLPFWTLFILSRSVTSSYYL